MNSAEFDCELLAGYADGELDSLTRGRVEAWLAEHPEARAELDAQRTFGRKSAIWSRLTSPTPSDAAWARMLNGVKHDLNPPAPATPRRVWRQAIAAVAAVAAMVVIAINVIPNRGDVANNTSIVSVESLPIVIASDVDILSVQGDDSVIVVGKPPLDATIELPAVGEIAIDADRTNPDGRTIVGNDKKPMLIVPSDKTPTTPVP